MSTEINKDMTIAQVLRINPKLADVFRSFGMQCVGCPSASQESLELAAKTHNMNLDKLLTHLMEGKAGDELVLPKGAILQRDKETFAIAPHLPGGVTNAATLRKIADVAEKYNAAAIKMTHGQRIAIVGLKRDDVDKAWSDLGMEPGAAYGMCVRYVNFCPGTTFCKRGQQDAVGVGLKLNELYHGLTLPSKFKIGISGCPNSCTEPAVRDLGLLGTSKGYMVMVGGNAGVRPRLANTIAEFVDEPAVYPLVEKIINYYKENGRTNERIGSMIDRIGLEEFKTAVLS